MYPPTLLGVVPVELPAETHVPAVAAGVETCAEGSSEVVSGSTLESPATAVTSFASAAGSDAREVKCASRVLPARRTVSTDASKARAICRDVPATRSTVRPALRAPTRSPKPVKYVRAAVTVAALAP